MVPRRDPGGRPRPLEVLSLGTDAVRVLDQRLLPAKIRYLECRTPRSVSAAISKMAVRGAPAIGVCGAFGMAISARRLGRRRRPRILDGLRSDGAIIAAARPTAADLGAAVDRVLARAEDSDPDDLVESVVAEALAIRHEVAEACRTIAEWGAELLEGAAEVLTYCNTGALATGVGTGTALGAVEYRWRRKKRLRVWVPETRPFLQGSRLTAFELLGMGIPFSVVTDSTCGHLMASGMVDVVIVGADRVASNGDVANKVGTYPLAVLAHEHGVPFYVAAPSSTFDVSLRSGREIPIEVRSGEELLASVWKSREVGTPNAYYPAFDVTPADLISAIVCEFGVLEPPLGQSIATTLQRRFPVEASTFAGRSVGGAG